MVSEGIDNVDADREAYGAIRVMVSTNQIGRGSGRRGRVGSLCLTAFTERTPGKCVRSSGAGESIVI